MLPSSIMTFMSLIQHPSTPLSVLVARETAWLMASSKLLSEMALSSVTRATLICSSASFLHWRIDLAHSVPSGEVWRTPRTSENALHAKFVESYTSGHFG